MKTRPQCKDIPAMPIMRFLRDHKGVWCNHWENPNEPSFYERSVHNAVPPNMPDKLVVAKMGSLIRRGLVSGCDCGCRGDFEITAEGEEWIRKQEEMKDKSKSI